MTVDGLISKYPRLWHMADARNARGIFLRGLMSTEALVQLYHLPRALRATLLAERRPDNVVLQDSDHGVSVIRDQKPMSVKKLGGSLKSGTVAAFLRFLNARVFFWPTEEKLVTMNSARAYRSDEQLVFVLRTDSLVRAHGRAMLLSPINSGTTSPFAWPRSIAMFQSIAAFDFEARRKAKNPIAELTVANGVPDVFEHVEKLQIWRGGTRLRSLRPPFDVASALELLGR